MGWLIPYRHSSAKNLEAYWQRVGRPRSTDETLIIKRLVWQWIWADKGQRSSLRKLARQIGVHHSYISRLWRKLLRGGLPDSFYFSPPVTLGDLEEARQRRIRIRGQLGHARFANPDEQREISFAGQPSIRGRVPPLHETPRSDEAPRQGRVKRLNFPLPGY